MSALTLAGFAAALRAARVMQPEAERHGLEEGAKLIEAEAKLLIGQERNEWPPLADRTVAQKRARGQTGRVSATDPLLATGRLRDSIQHSVSGRTAIIGTNDEIGADQEFGTPNARFPIPPRPFLGAAAFRKGDEAAKAIGKTVQHVLAGRRLP